MGFMGIIDNLYDVFVGWFLILVRFASDWIEKINFQFPLKTKTNT